MDAPLQQQLQQQPLVVVESLAPLRRFLSRAELPPSVLTLQEEEARPQENGKERGSGSGNGSGSGGEACVLLVRGMVD